MPIYEYLCEACGTLTERMQKVGAAGPRVCPECGSRKIARLVSRTSFQLKGGGWYADLYASPGKDGERRGTHAPPAEPQAAAKPEAPAAPKPREQPEGAKAPPAPAPARRRRRDR